MQQPCFSYLPLILTDKGHDGTMSHWIVDIYLQKFVVEMEGFVFSNQSINSSLQTIAIAKAIEYLTLSQDYQP
jgi:hypothetical protein